MIEKDDWRLQGQENYLKRITLIYQNYGQFKENENWDHDHCEFCNCKFSLVMNSETLQEGYSTEDNYRWICKKCYEDFHEMFEWKIKMQ